LADAAVQTHARSEAPLPDAPLDVPFKYWWAGPTSEVEQRVWSALRDSHRRRLKLFGRWYLPP
jgi:hypothetical protein